MLPHLPPSTPPGAGGGHAVEGGGILIDLSSPSPTPRVLHQPPASPMLPVPDIPPVANALARQVLSIVRNRVDHECYDRYSACLVQVEQCMKADLFHALMEEILRQQRTYPLDSLFFRQLPNKPKRDEVASRLNTCSLPLSHRCNSCGGEISFSLTSNLGRNNGKVYFSCQNDGFFRWGPRVWILMPNNPTTDGYRPVFFTGATSN